MDQSSRVPTSPLPATIPESSPPHGAPLSEDLRLVGEPSFSTPILVVDDDENDRFLAIWNLRRALWRRGDLQVDWAEDGATAVERMGARDYSLVLLDWNMPRGDGRSVLQVVRGSGSSVPVVVVSREQGKALQGDLDRWSAAFVPKVEMSPVMLRAAILTALALVTRPRADQG